VDRARVSLNNPAFSGRLRQQGRSPGYVRRPTPRPASVIQDIKLTPSRAVAGPKLNPVKVYARSAIAARSQTTIKLATPNPKRTLVQTVKHHHPQKSAVLWRQAVKAPAGVVTVQPKQPHKRQTTVLYAMAGLLFIVGIAVSINGLRTNRQVAAQVKQISRQSDSGSPDKTTAPSTTKPSASDISGYAVAPNLPRYIDIAKLAVHARIKSMSVNSKNQLQSPNNVYDAGWYNASAQPGQPGAMVVDGHISSWTTQGVFYGLNKLVTGDPISITRGDGKVFVYKVVKTEIDDVNSVDMSSLLVSQDTAKPGLNLISCSGDVIPGSNEFNKRIVVYAVES